jgi:hypothetical protein
MQISDSRRFLFVHVQKTGGVSIDKLLTEHVDDLRHFGSRHLTLGQALKKEPDLAHYWTFGFVRNPWARMVSWWAMIDNWREKWGPDSGREPATGVMAGNKFWHGTAKYADFDEFVMRGPDEWARLRTPQIDYLTTPHRRADFIGRTETFDADVRAVCARLGLPIPDEAPRHNVHTYTGYQESFSDATRQRVAEVFAKDIDLFHYEF